MADPKPDEKTAAAKALIKEAVEELLNERDIKRQEKEEADRKQNSGGLFSTLFG